MTTAAAQAETLLTNWHEAEGTLRALGPIWRAPRRKTPLDDRGTDLV